MCGIAGIHFKHDVDGGVLDRATAHFARSLHHRGPDHFGAHRTARSVYANLRLAIVDRSGGDQPIYAANRTNGATRLTFHAESNKTYTVEARMKVEADSWLRVADVLAVKTNRTVSIIDGDSSFPEAARYYRLVTP